MRCTARRWRRTHLPKRSPGSPCLGVEHMQGKVLGEATKLAEQIKGIDADGPGPGGHAS